MNKYFIIFFYVCSSLLCAAPNDNVVITTRVYPNPASVSDSIFLEVTANQELRNVSFRLPQLQDFRLQYTGQSSQSRYMNGVVEQSTSWRFYIHGVKEGSHVIPEFQCIGQNNTTIAIPETRFTVGSAPQRQSQSYAQNQQAPALLRIGGTLPQKWYVGQCCPVELQLLTLPNVRGQLSSLPVKEGDAFSASRLIESPHKKNVNVQGQSYSGLVWPSLITALKSGQYPLKFTINLELEQPRRARDMLDDDPLSLFSSLTSMFSRTEPVTLESNPIQVNVLPLPQPQPENFTQAIGLFNVGNPQVVEHELIQHEPCTLQVKINGSGNFENVQPPELQYDAEKWRVYDPKNHFEPKNDLGFEGMLEFTYTIVPLVEGQLELPKVVFSSFNPKTGQYDTVTRSALGPVHVKPSLRPTVAPTMPSSKAPIVSSSSIPTSVRNIFIGKIVWETHHCHFWLIQIILALLTFVFVIFYLRAHNQHYQSKKAREEQLNNAYRSMLTAFKKHQSTEFYTALYQLIVLTLETKGCAIRDALEGRCGGLSVDQCTLIQKIENIYQESRFGKTNAACPEDLSAIKQLIHDIK